MGRPQQKKPGKLARAVSSEIRRELGDRQISARSIARHLDRSTPYVTARLNDETDFSLNDVEVVCEVLGIPPASLLSRAERRVRSSSLLTLPTIVGREHLAELDAVAEDQYTMPSPDDVSP